MELFLFRGGHHDLGRFKSNTLAAGVATARSASPKPPSALGPTPPTTQAMKPSNTTATVWLSMPLFNLSPPSPPAPPGSGTELCYKFEYGEGLSSYVGSRPVIGIPADHPMVTRPGRIRSCTTRLGAGDRIPASGYWHETGCGVQVPSGDLFYAYNFPDGASANTGYMFDKTMGVYFVQDEADDVYFVVTVGKAHGSRYRRAHLHMTATSTGLAGTDMRVIRGDDSREVSWNTHAGTGRFQWKWGSCCTDGMVLGPIPSDGFTMTLKASFWHHVNQVALASYNEVAKGLDFTNIDIGAIFGNDGELKVNGFTCDTFCASFASGGECTTSEFCGWCGATSTCISQTQRYNCAADYTPPLTCFSECSEQTSRAACLSRPGCGFLFDRASPDAEAGHCVSGTPAFSPCDTTGSDMSAAVGVRGGMTF